MKKLMTILVALGAGVVLADVSVLDVTCTPRTPWNGLVDVSYTIASDDPEAEIYVNPVAYDADRRLTLFPSAFTGDGATNTVKAGKHKMVWDATKDFGAFSSSSFQLKIYAGERLPRYVWIDLSSGADSTNYPVHFSVVGPDLSKDDCRTTQLWMRLVPPGEFWMGSPENELGRSEEEKLHHVTLTKPFYIGVFEVTQKQWALVMGNSNRSYFRSAGNSEKRPYESDYYSMMRGLTDPLATTGYGQDSFVSKLCIRTQNGGWELPTEAQWEYACRAGTTTALNNGKNLTDTTWSQNLAEVAAYYGNCYAGQTVAQSSVAVGTQTVGSYAPNALGLYDMLGNVWEYCRDGEGKYGTADVVDPAPIVWQRQPYMRCKGGAWNSKSCQCRSGARHTFYSGNASYDIGFRIFCSEGF